MGERVWLCIRIKHALIGTHRRDAKVWNYFKYYFLINKWSFQKGAS